MKKIIRSVAALALALAIVGGASLNGAMPVYARSTHVSSQSR